MSGTNNKINLKERGVCMSAALDVFEGDRILCANLGCMVQVPKPPENDSYPAYCSRACEVEMQKLLAARKSVVKKDSLCRTGDMDFMSFDGLPLPGDRSIPGW